MIKAQYTYKCDCSLYGAIREGGLSFVHNTFCNGGVFHDVPTEPPRGICLVYNNRSPNNTQWAPEWKVGVHFRHAHASLSV